MTLARLRVAPPDGETMYVSCSFREIEVLGNFLKDGADNETIARRMKPEPLSAETIKTHMRRIYQKAGLAHTDHTSCRVGLALGIVRGEIVIVDPNGRAVRF